MLSVGGEGMGPLEVQWVTNFPCLAVGQQKRYPVLVKLGEIA